MYECWMIDCLYVLYDCYRNRGKNGSTRIRALNKNKNIIVWSVTLNCIPMEALSSIPCEM